MTPKEHLTQLLETCPKLWRTRRIAEHPSLVSYLNELYPRVALAIQINSFLESKSPYCVECSNPVNLAGKLTCSIACRTVQQKKNSQQRITKQKATLLEKYGVDNIRNIPGSEKKRKESMLAKYSALVSPATVEKTKDRANELQTKGRLTLKEKYNVTNPGQLSGHRAKSIETLQKNFGVDHYSKSAEFKLLASERSKIKWDTFVPATISISSIDTDCFKETIFTDPNKVITFSCSECGTTDYAPTETVKWRIVKTGTCCKKCAALTSGSSAENEIRKFINDLGYSTLNNKKLLGLKEIDICIPDLNIGVEYHGLFWHNDQRIGSSYHHDKLTVAQAKGITLIQIFEDEWVHTPDIVKSRLTHLLGKETTSVAARKCSVQAVTTVEEKRFLTENHIQGYSASSVKLGLYFNNELISLMTFSKLSRAKGHSAVDGHFELLRFCNKLNLRVVGGASKLFAHFVKHYAPIKVLSFADKRWSTGNLYKQLKFTAKGDTRINYWYIDMKNVKRIHRYTLRKTKEDDQSLTEYENRLAQGYNRIWDCGSSKWEWNR